MEDKKDKKTWVAAFDLKNFVKLCFKSWKLIGSCVIAVPMLAAAYLYVRKSSAEVFAQLMLPPESNAGGLLPYLDIASSLPISDMLGSSTTENEIVVIKSHTVFERTARDLGLNVSYLQKRYPLKWYPAYDNAQLKLTTLPSIPDTIRATLRFDIDPNSDGTFDIKCKFKRRTLADVEKAVLPVTLETSYGPFTISKTEFYGQAPVNSFRILFCSYNAAAYSYTEAVQVYAPSKKTDVIDLSFFTNDPAFGEKLLSKIIENYNYVGNKNRDDNSTRTLDFVNKRMSTLEGELAQAEEKMTAFKKANDIVNPEADIATLVGKESTLDAQILGVQTELEILGMAKDFLANPENNYALLPSVPGAGPEMAAYNDLILKRMKLASSAKESNLVLRKLNEQIDALRENIIVTVDRSYENTSMRLSALRRENAGTETRKGSVPGIEQEYATLGRNLYMLQQLYVMLLKQREEAEMSMLKTSVSLLTVDAPYTVPAPTEMGKSKVLAIALFFGLCIGLAMVFLLKLPKASISGKRQIEKMSAAPVLGSVEVEKGEDNALISADSHAAEALRMLRSNVMLALEGAGRNVVMVTSALNGEGASFIAANLAVSLSKAGYRTVLVEANLRSPQLAELMPGLKPSASLPDVIGSNGRFAPEFSEDGMPVVIGAGHYDGNPADLLCGEGMDKFMAGLTSASDYVVVDVANMEGYSDVFAMADCAALTLVVAKTGVTTPKEMEYINGIYADGRLPRLACVVNSVEN